MGGAIGGVGGDRERDTEGFNIVSSWVNRLGVELMGGATSGVGESGRVNINAG